jgi:N-acetylmuramoyl-L-alanine amidase-like protein
MTNMEIDLLLTETAKSNKSITEKMSLFSNLFLETPYNIVCSGDGPYALYEPQPLVNFKETNCMVFCEHILALSISDSWDNFFNNLQQIRYKDGMIGMRTRNHYTMGDWLPENNWLLDDVSAKVAGEFTKKVTRTISHKKFFEGKGVSDLRYVKPDREMAINFVPKEVLNKVEDNYKNGDVLALLFANKSNIFSAHMLMIYKTENQTIIRESSSSKMTTFDTPYLEWVNKIKKSNKYIGIAVMRVREELNKPGKIILPWEISTLKTELN